MSLYKTIMAHAEE